MLRLEINRFTEISSSLSPCAIEPSHSCLFMSFHWYSLTTTCGGAVRVYDQFLLPLTDALITFEFTRDFHDIFMEAWASGPEMLSGDLSLHCSSVKPHMPYSNGVNTCHKGPFRSLTRVPKRPACHDHPIYPNNFQKHLTAVDSTHFVSPNWFLQIMKLQHS